MVQVGAGFRVVDGARSIFGPHNHMVSIIASRIWTGPFGAIGTFVGSFVHRVQHRAAAAKNCIQGRGGRQGKVGRKSAPSPGKYSTVCSGGLNALGRSK